MRIATLLFAVGALAGAAPWAGAADQDYNGKWDIVVNAAPASYDDFTTTKAWWLGIAGAGTPDMKLDSSARRTAASTTSPTRRSRTACSTSSGPTEPRR